MDYYEEDDWDDDLVDPDDDSDYWCVVCGETNSHDECDCCGGALCPMHAEVGAHFCPNCPTPGWIPGREHECFVLDIPIVYDGDLDIPF